MLEKRGS